MRSFTRKLQPTTLPGKSDECIRQNLPSYLYKKNALSFRTYAFLSSHPRCTGSHQCFDISCLSSNKLATPFELDEARHSNHLYCCGRNRTRNIPKSELSPLVRKTFSLNTVKNEHWDTKLLSVFEHWQIIAWNKIAMRKHSWRTDLVHSGKNATTESKNGRSFELWRRGFSRTDHIKAASFFSIWARDH